MRELEFPVAASATRVPSTSRRGLHNAPFETAEYQLTSPPAVINGLIVTGSSVADNSRTNAASGEVRAFDARTGALRWTWDPVPRDSTDAQWNSWRGAMGHTTGAANAWSVIAADSARDLVFVPTGSASPDYYGGERVGDNRYANSIVALRASTGKVVWHFQTVHHDLWDYDNASPPALVTVVRDGRRIDVVLQATKTGQLFVLDRDTGKPIFPVEERPVPASTIFGERASPTQPFNTVLPPLSPQRFVLDSVWGATPADRDACLAQIRPLRNDGPFTPPSFQGTLSIPSNVGGAHWGGLAFDPARQTRDRSGQSHRGVRPAHPPRRARHRRRASEPIATRRSVHAHARHAVRHAATNADRAEWPAVHAAAVRLVGRDRSRHRHACLGRSTRRSVGTQAGVLPRWRKRRSEHRTSAARSSPRAASCSSAPRSTTCFAHSTSRRGANCGKDRSRPERARRR